MKHLRSLSALAFAFVLLVFLTAAASAQTAVSLSGQITNDRGERLPGLRLALVGPTFYQATTDADGRYTFSVPAGNYRFHINGPKSYDSSVHAPPVYNLETQWFDVLQNSTLDLRLPFKKLSVHVQDSQGTAVANVLMAADGGFSSNLAIGSLLPTGTLFASGNSYYAGALTGTVTNANGDVDFWLLPTATDPTSCGSWGCGYFITAQPPAGSQLALTSLSDVTLTQDSSATITLQPGVSLTGRVTDAQGNPLSGLLVTLRGYYPTTGAALTTDANGRYGFSVSTGWYALIVDKNWDLSKPYDSWDFDLRSGMFEVAQNMTLDLPLPFKRVTVHVVDTNGQPVAGAGLAASGFGGDGMTIGGVSFSGSSSYWYNPSMYVNSVVTDASGNATLRLFPESGLYAWGYTITAYPLAETGLPSQSLSGVLVTDDTSLTINYGVPPVTLVTVSGRITDADGNGLPNQSVDLGGIVSQTDSSGYYTISRDAGSYPLTIQGGVPVGSPLHAPQSYSLYSGWLAITQDKTLDFALPFQRVNVHAVDANDQPVAGANLTTFSPTVYGVTSGGLSFSGTSSYPYDPYVNMDHVATDANGNATLWLLPSGNRLETYGIRAFVPPETGLTFIYGPPVLVAGETNVTLRFAGALPTKAPVISSISPTSVEAASPSFTLVVNGTDFYKSSVVRWNGADRSTTFVSSTQLTAVIPSTDVFSPGTANVTVWTPAPGGGESSSLPFTIYAVIPSATIKVFTALHTVGAGTTPGVQKAPLTVSLKIFDRNAVPSAELKDYATIWNSGPGLIAPWARITGPFATTFGGGPANLYTVLVPAAGSANKMTSGRYVVVGKVDGAETYVGAATDPLAPNSVTDEYLQVVQKSDGEIVPAMATSAPGSPVLGTPTPSPTATPPLAPATRTPKPKPTSKVVPTSPAPKPTATPKKVPAATPTPVPAKVSTATPAALPTQTLVPTATATPKKALTATPAATRTLPPTKTPHLTPTPRDKPTKR